MTSKQLRFDNGEVYRLDIDGGVEHIKTSQKTSKSQNLAKSRKKLSKSENSTNFDVMEAKPKFLTLNAKIIFNCLRLAFNKTTIFQNFDLEYHIQFKTNVLGYANGEMLSQLTSGTNLNRVVI